jgi:hypothetical protein
MTCLDQEQVLVGLLHNLLISSCRFLHMYMW